MNVSSASSSIKSTQDKDVAKKNPPPPLAIDKAFKRISSSDTQIYMEKHGRGETLQDGDLVTVHYEGWLAKDYTKFDSSRDKRKPFEFELGKGNVIQGWDKSLKGIRVGSKIQIKIPAEEAYGDSGFKAAGVPAKADLIFKIEILDMERTEVKLDADALRKKMIEEARLKRRKMEYRQLAEQKIVKNGKVQELEEQPLTEAEKKMIERVNAGQNRNKIPDWVNPKLKTRLEGGTENFVSEQALEKMNRKSRRITSA